ncbi:RNA-directed DNA polymerase, eukaryota, reverse transcriptase zinc-binding domain protein [Tanacetum coccineum]
MGVDSDTSDAGSEDSDPSYHLSEDEDDISDSISLAQDDDNDDDDDDSTLSHTINDPFLTRLCYDNMDDDVVEQVDSDENMSANEEDEDSDGVEKYIERGVSYPSYDPSINWKLTKPILGLMYESCKQLKESMIDYGVADGYQLFFPENDYKKILRKKCGENNDENGEDGVENNDENGEDGVENNDEKGEDGVENNDEKGEDGVENNDEKGENGVENNDEKGENDVENNDEKDGVGKKIEAVKDIVPYAEHRQCTRHIYANFKKKFCGIQFRNLFWAAAYSTTEQHFEDKMKELKVINNDAYNHLIERNPKSWSRAFLRHWSVIPSDYNVFEARNEYGSFVMDIQARTCSCRSWQLSGIPCVHTVAALAFLNKDPETYLSCKECDFLLGIYCAIRSPLISHAHREFFISGKMLGEINATLKSLIPKGQTPSKVIDFRPIACCNVLYKCISKIITNRIKLVLGSLVSNNQSAFIPGRKTLEKFGFHEKMVNWIMQCVTTAGFTLNVNEERIGYFKGGRGLRQGDPISPCLFTLIMEVFSLMLNRQIESDLKFQYHFGCKSMKLVHVCFADDLVVMCHEDSDSVEVIKKALDEFSTCSGLLPNNSKSIVFFGSLCEEDRHVILNVLPFAIGKLLNKVKNWKNKSLSYAGRLQVIAAVLESIHVYWASVFFLPITVINEINKLLKGFLWNQGDIAKGKAKVAWTTLCRPKDQGGLGLKNLQTWNQALLAKNIWNIATKKDNLWVKWVHSVKLRNKSIWEVSAAINDSWGWKNLLTIRDIIMNNVKCIVRSVMGHLFKTLSHRDLYDARLKEDLTLRDMITNGQWNWPEEWYEKFLMVTQIACPTLNDVNTDKIVWRNRDRKDLKFSVSIAYADMSIQCPIMPWLTTQGKLRKWEDHAVNRCCLCRQESEDINHILFECPFSRDIWRKVSGMVDIDHNGYDLMNIIQSLINAERNGRIFKDAKRSGEEVFKCIMEVIKHKLLGIIVKDSKAVRDVEAKWKNALSGSVVDENRGREDVRQNPKKGGTSKDVVASLDQRVVGVETSMAELKNQVEGLEGLDSDFTKVSTHHQTIKDLQADVTLYKRSLASGGGNTNHGLKIEVPKPSPFMGKREARAVDDFLWEMEQYLEGVKVVDDASNIKMATRYLKDTAALWWRRRYADIERGTATINTWAEFVADFKKQFYPENAKNEAKSRFLKLKQSETIREYTKLERRGVQDLSMVIAHVEVLIDFSTRRDSSKPKDKKVNQDKGGGEKNAQPKVDAARKPPTRKDKKLNTSYKSGGCFICDGPHRARDCPKKASINGLSAQGDEDASDGGSMGSIRILNAIKAKTKVPKVVEKGLQYVEATINCVKVRALVDSGATHNFMADDEAKRLGINDTKGSGTIKAVNSPAKATHGVAKDIRAKISVRIMKKTRSPRVLGKENGIYILQSIDHGPFELGTTRDTLGTTPEGGVLLGPERPHTYDDLNDNDKKRFDDDVRATNIVLQGLPKDIYKLINHNIEAKAIWDNVKMLLAGSELTKEDRESQLYDEFKRFKMLLGENINEYYDRFVTTVKLNKGLKETNHEQLYAYLKQHEKHVAQDRIIIEKITPTTNAPLAFVSNVQPYAQLSHVQSKQHPSSSTPLQSPHTNNQLRTSSNTRNQATVQDGRVVVQNVQGRQNQNQRNFARGAGAAGNGGAQNRAGNANESQGKPIKCYNCNGLGHIARNYTQPKRPQNSDFFKDKMLLMQAQENDDVLDDEELLFLAGDQTNTFDADVDDQPVRDLAQNDDNIFQANECDAFDSDVDDEPTTQSIFMTNLSSIGPANLQAGQSNASILSEVHDLENNIDHCDIDQNEHEIHNEVQQKNIIDSNVANLGNSNVIPYEQYLSVNEVSVEPSCASSVPIDESVLHDNNAYIPHDPLVTELSIYKQQVAMYEQRAKFDLALREQKMDEQIRMLIQDHNKREENLKNELHSGKLQLNSTIKSSYAYLPMCERSKFYSSILL